MEFTVRLFADALQGNSERSVRALGLRMDAAQTSGRVQRYGSSASRTEIADYKWVVVKIKVPFWEP